MADKQVRFGIKVAQMTGLYNEGMRDAWLEADRLGFDTGWGHDHLLNQNDYTRPEEEGLTILSALLALEADPWRPAGHGEHLPPPGRAGQDDDHDRPHL